MSVSGHAYDRIKKRGKHLVAIYAQDAFDLGDLPDDEFMEKVFKKWSLGEYQATDYRVWKGLIWCFVKSKKGSRITLVTVLHL